MIKRLNFTLFLCGLCLQILIQSVCETMVPKLVAEDIPLLFSLLNDVFPQVKYTRAEMSGKLIFLSHVVR